MVYYVLDILNINEKYFYSKKYVTYSIRYFTLWSFQQVWEMMMSNSDRNLAAPD